MMKVLNGPEVTAKLSAALKDIARLTGFSEKQVTLAEAGSILKTCAGRTRQATPQQADLRSRQRAIRGLSLTSAPEPGDVSINVGIRGQAGRVWMKTRSKTFKLAGKQSWDGQTFTPMNFHWQNTRWATIQRAVQNSSVAIAKERPLGLGSIGLARQSWIQIADALGIKLENVPGGGISSSALAKARKAIASNGQYYINGSATQVEEPSMRFFVTMINSLPYWSKMGLDRVLAGVLAGRVGLYRRTFANGAFKSIESAAHNYPWMRTSLTA